MAKRKVNENLIITKVRLKGFKSIENVTVTLENGLNILIGKNASGKSNFLECLKLVMSFRFRRHSLLFKYARLELLVDDENTFVWETEREAAGLAIQNREISETTVYREKLSIDGKRVYDSKKKTVRFVQFKDRKAGTFRDVRGIIRRLTQHDISPLLISFNLPEKLDCISNSYSIEISSQNEELDFGTYPNTLGFVQGALYNAQNFFKISNSVKEISPKSFLNQLKISGEILGNLKKYTPVEAIRFNPNLNVYKKNKHIVVDNIKLDFKVNSNWIPWSSLSDGTRRLFYMVAEISGKENGFVLVEEPELGVHPNQFNLIMDFLKEQSRLKQIIISTHSPYALNCLNEKELNSILLTSYDLQKATQIRHLTKLEINKAKKYMSHVGFLSDYWLHSDLES